MFAVPAALYALTGCSGGPVVDAASPEPVPAGEPLELTGSGFAAESKVALVANDGATRDLAIAYESPQHVRAYVPDDIAEGGYTLAVDGTATAVVVKVAPPRDEEPCTGQWITNNSLSLRTGRIRIDRFYTDTHDATLDIAIADVTGVELVRTALPGEGACSAVLLRLANGRAIVFQDDTRYDLADRAAKTAKALDKPLVDKTGLGH